jgi:molecular chaperone DnaK
MSSRNTIDYGIDLGIRHSLIAVVNGEEPEIIKNSDDQERTPSAVFINKQGVLRVGSRAKAAIAGEWCHQDVYTELKRQMGTPHEYEFASSGQRRKPEELSAEVLKELRASVEARTGEVIQSAVITVPAAFELHQCDATRRAAELAGFKSSPLLHEPVAVALAYGFQIDSEKAYWMVYNFGGGTFDAALINAEEGMINVVNHGGDNFLGGSDIDWAIIEKIIIPQLSKNFDLPGFARGSDRWGMELRCIKHAVEAAKLELSTKEITTLSGGVAFEDGSGEMIECDEISLSRTDLIRIAEPLISRSIKISQDILKDTGLGLQAVQRVILVGGPTKAPYIREMLNAGLGIPIDFSQEPLTVVARGAAVFASTQKVDSKLQKKAAVGQFQVQISDKYKAVGCESYPLIAGKVTSPDGIFSTGFTVEFVNCNTNWRSGQVPLNGEGAFMANLLADKGSRNTFRILLSNSRGSLQKTVPDQVAYTVGAVIEEQPLLKSIGLGREDNTVDWFFKSGSILPQKKRWPSAYRTTVPLKAGQPGEAIKFPIVEGGNGRADRNRVVGFLEINSSMVRRDLPVGSEFEITLKIDESRTIILEAYFPLLDEEFSKQLEIEKMNADAFVISATLREEKERLNELKEKAEDAGEQSIVKELERLESDKDRDEAVREAKVDAGAAEKAQARILELQIRLDAIEEKLKWPILVSEVASMREELRLVSTEFGNLEHQEHVDDWIAVVDSIITKKQHERLKRKLVECREIYTQIIVSSSEFRQWAIKDVDRISIDPANLAIGELILKFHEACSTGAPIAGFIKILDALLSFRHEISPKHQTKYTTEMIRFEYARNFVQFSVKMRRHRPDLLVEDADGNILIKRCGKQDDNF